LRKMPRTPSPIAWKASSVEIEFTQSTIRERFMACFMSLSTAKVISAVRSMSTRSGVPLVIWSIREARVSLVGKSSNPSIWRSTDSRPLAKMGSSLYRRTRVINCLPLKGA
jgi:hypothetical protein